jgi:hypothetical protein
MNIARGAILAVRHTVDDQLAARLAEIERRLTALEGKQQGSPRSIYQARRVRELEAVEQAVGLVWFNRLAAALVLVGLALGAMWANGRGYLSPAIRDGLAGAATIVALVIGARAVGSADRGRHAFGLGVAITGALGAEVVLAAAARLDGVLPLVLAAILAALLALAVLAIAARRHLAPLALIATAAGLAVPLFVWTARVPIVLILCAHVAIVLAVAHARRFTGVIALCAVACVAYLVALGAPPMAAAPLVIVVAFALVAPALPRGDREGVIAASLGLVALGPLGGVATGAVIVGGSLRVRASREWCFAGGALLVLAAAARLPVRWIVPAWELAGTAIALVALRARFARSTHTIGLSAIAGAGLLLAARAASPHLSTPETLAWIVGCAGGLAIHHDSPHLSRLALSSWLVAHAFALALTLRLTFTHAAPFGLWAAIVLAAYAVVTLAVGVTLRRRASRVLGLALLVVVVAKVFTIDVWRLGEGPRVAAFLILGAALFLASFLYGRLTDRS